MIVSGLSELKAWNSFQRNYLIEFF